jgi:O-antigen ligase
MVFTLPLDIYGRLLESPVTVTVFHVVLGVTLVSWVLRLYADPERRVRFSAMEIGMGTLVFAAVWSLPNSLDRVDTAIAIVRLVFLWAFALLYANVMSSRRLIDWVVWVVIGTGVLNGAVALAQYFIPGFEFGNVRSVNQAPGTGVVLRRTGALFWDPNYLAGFLCITFLAAVVLFVHARRWSVAGVSLASAAVIGGGLLVTFSRTGWVGAAVGLVVVALTAPKGRRLPMILAGVLLVTVVMAVSPGLILDRVASIGEVEEDMSNATRYYMALSSVGMIRDYPVFGTGLAAFDMAFETYREPGTLTVIRPHQLPLSLWAEMGVAGLLAELALLASLVATFWRRRTRGPNVYEVIAAAGLVSLLVQSLFQYYLYFEYLWLFAALAVAANRLGRLDEEASHDTA